MRILHVVQALSRKLGGVQTVLLDLAKAQAEAGTYVDIIATNIDAPTGVLDVPVDRFVQHGGARIRYFPTQFRPLLYSTQLKKYVGAHLHEYDIVHVHGLYRFPPTYAAYQARRQGVPYVIQPHGSLDPYLYDKSSRSVKLKRLYERWFDLPNLHAAGAIHYTTEMEYGRATFLKLRAPSFVVPIGVDRDRFERLPSRGAFRAEHKLGDAPLILFLGRLHFVKGLDLLIPAFDAVRKHVPNAHLLIAGPENADYGRKVRGWVEERRLKKAVHFIGHLDRADVPKVYVDADLFVLPSYTENFGITVVEAMACGLPVVISDQVNIHREVAESGAGVVTHCDAGEVAQALIGLLNDEGRRHVMGEAGRRMVRARYAWPQIVEALTHEYENVIRRARIKAGATRDGEGIA